MSWLWHLRLAVLLFLSGFKILATALIVPRQVDQADIALHERIASYQIPIHSYNKPSRSLNHIRGREDGEDGSEMDILMDDIPRLNLGVFQNSAYFVSVTIGGNQVINLLIDTGSSDTWVVQKDFECISLNSLGLFGNAKEDCRFGKLFDPNSSLTFQTLDPDGDSFNVRYADGSGVTGYVGQDILDLSGLLVNLTIGIANITTWNGDSHTSGILGLGYPGTIPSKSGHLPYDWIPPVQFAGETLPFDCHETYPSLVQTLTLDGYKPIFSIAMEKGVKNESQFSTKGGVLAFNGVPNIPGLGFPFAKAKMNPWYNESVTCPSDFQQIGYGFEIDGITDGDEMWIKGKYKVKIDTGASLLVLPYWFLRKLFYRMGPELDVTSLPWIVDCNATIPEIGFVIGDVVIRLDRNQIIREKDRRASYAYQKPMCFTNIMANHWGDEIILGMPFLQGVLVVYDLGKKEVRIGKRFSVNPTFVEGFSDELKLGVPEHPSKTGVVEFPTSAYTAFPTWLSPIR
ncbi:Barrierpepsin [Dactylellina cionopaga]|nr:Barrierpepsin [Dactylellina cionopaga]